MTRYGKGVVDKFVSAFVAEGITTISGFMYGIDTQVHQKTVDYGGKTIAVFGCGLNVIYPLENEKLYQEIIDGGGSIVSEYDDDAKPHLWKFPQRNKIVAELSSLGVLVVEAGETSGALITAKLAKKAGKKVYAVPGPIDSLVSVGCNNLIKNGEGTMVTGPEDILGKSFLEVGSPKISNSMTGLELKIYKALELEPLNIDEIAVKIGKDVVEIGSCLSMMGIKSLITESGGKYYLNRS